MSGLSVNTTNLASTVILKTSFEAATLSLAALAIKSPIGALGGAIFGAVHYVSQIPLTMVGGKLLNADHPQASTAAKTLATALVYFGSYAAAWGILALAGFSLTLSHMVTLTIVSIVYAVVLDVFLQCVGIKMDETMPRG